MNHYLINIIKQLHFLLFGSRTLALVIWQSAVATSNTSINVATGTVVFASLAVPEISSVAASQAVIVISGHHDLHLTRKSHRSHLRAGFT